MAAQRQGGLEEKVHTPVDRSTGVRDDPWAQWGRPGDSQGGVGRFPPSPTGDKGSFKGKYQDPFDNGKGRVYAEEDGFRSAEESPTPVDTRTEFEKMLAYVGSKLEVLTEFASIEIAPIRPKFT